MKGNRMEQQGIVKKRRMANIELLRILAMLMVVMLHYLDKGGILPDMTGDLDSRGYAAWILETLSIVAVNVYMLISGYFLTESQFKSKRLIGLLCQIWFYSLLIPAGLLAAGILKPGELTVYKLLQYIFPTLMGHYWFATAYVMLYLFTPVLRTAVHHMKKNQLRLTIVLLLLFFSVSKSLLPVRLETDNLGYDVIWFICVYLCAAYIRLYGIPFFDRAWKGFLGYLAGCGAILGVTLFVRLLYLKTGAFEDFLTAAYHYNHILNLFAAIFLFYGFLRCRPAQGRLSEWICRIAPYTFGVYLLHEHLAVRYLWPGWIGAGAEGDVLLLVCRAVGSVLFVFTVGILTDACRGAVFSLAGKALKGRRADRFLKRIDEEIRKGESDD